MEYVNNKIDSSLIKACKKCNIEKPLSEFRSRGGKMKHLKKSYCNKCLYSEHKKWVNENQDKVREYREQLAVSAYKKAGGSYEGSKGETALSKWTKQNWRTKSGKPSSETGERYLPEKAIKALSSSEYAATTRAKREGAKAGKQFVEQPKSIAKKTAKYRK
jgi:hypothetical protein